MSPKSIVLAAAVATLAALAGPAAASTSDGPDRVFGGFVLGRAARLDRVVLVPDAARDLPTADQAGILTDTGAATADTVFAPAEVVSPVSTAHGTTVVPIAMPVDLAAGRHLFPAIGTAQVSLPDFYQAGGVPRATGGHGRYDPVGSGLAFDNTLAVIPEPRVWALLLAGYGMIGFALRRRGWARHVAG